MVNEYLEVVTLRVVGQAVECKKLDHVDVWSGRGRIPSIGVGVGGKLARHNGCSHIYSRAREKEAFIGEGRKLQRAIGVIAVNGKLQCKRLLPITLLQWCEEHWIGEAVARAGFLRGQSRDKKPGFWAILRHFAEFMHITYKSLSCR